MSAMSCEDSKQTQESVVPSDGREGTLGVMG
jgi:hypothetical protein